MSFLSLYTLEAVEKFSPSGALDKKFELNS